MDDLNNFHSHIAIVDIPTIRKIALGEKTIESRFSKHCIKPFGRVHKGDIVLLKSSGGGIQGYFYADDVESLKDFDIAQVKQQYNDRIVADDTFWVRKTTARYASLIHCIDAKMTESSLHFKRVGMDGWIILPKNQKRNIVCFAGQICSGKSDYAKALANQLGAEYLNLDAVNTKNYIAYHANDSVFSSNAIVFDGICSEEMYRELQTAFGDVTLVFVDANAKDRYSRFLSKHDKNIPYHDFAEYDHNSVGEKITVLKSYAKYVLKCAHEENMKDAVETMSRILYTLLTGNHLPSVKATY